LAFVCALLGSSVWVITATRLGLPVSTTHSIIGAIVGVGISAYGVNAPVWGWEGLGKIFASWIISPTIAGIVALSIFTITRVLVLTHKNSFDRGLMLVPITFIVTIFICVVYIAIKGGKTAIKKITPENGGLIFGTASLSAVFVSVLSYGFLVPWLRRKYTNEETLRWYQVFYIHWLPEQPKDVSLAARLESLKDHGAILFNNADSEAPKLNPDSSVKTLEAEPVAKDTSLLGRFISVMTHGARQDVVQVRSKHVARTHNHATKFDSKTESLYSSVQVISASFASFAHGSNDVANAIGPLAGIFYIWQTGNSILGEADVPIWILAFGGAAISIGFITMGYFLMRSLGNNITFHSPSRGFSMELGAALTVVTASFIGLPISTTHCIVGATVFVGLGEGKWGAVNWRMLVWVMFSWVLTLPVAGTVAGLMFALCSRSPHF